MIEVMGLQCLAETEKQIDNFLNLPSTGIEAELRWGLQLYTGKMSNHSPVEDFRQVI